MEDSQPYRILYMDDDEDVATMVQISLQQQGYGIDIAPDGIRGMAKLRSGEYHLALVDYEMPGPNGIAICRDIVENGPDVPVIIMSAVSDIRIAAQALRAGAADYVVKENDASHLEYLPVSLDLALEKQRILSENRETHAALKESERRYRTLFEHNPQCIMEVDLQGRVLSVNQAGVSMLGKSDPEEILGNTTMEMATPDSRCVLQQALEDATAGHSSHELEVDATWDNGSRYFSISVIPLYSNTGAVEKAMVIGVDTTDRKLFELKLIHMAQHDILTDLPNRNLIYDHLGMAMARAQRQHHRLAFLHIDLDDFKKINDQYGYTTGDVVLVEVAKRLKSGIRESDIAARLGGDELGIVLSDLEDQEGAERVARDLIERLSRPYQLGSLRLQVRCSIGIALFPDHGDTQEVIFSKADRAMNTAKRAGKDCYRFARKGN